MLNVTDLRNGAVFREDNNIFQVLNYEHIKMGRGSGTIKLKVRNLRTGSVVEKSFITGARVDEADVQKKKAQYLYQDQDSLFLMDPVGFEQFPLSKSVVGEQARYLRDGLEVHLIILGDEGLGIELPNSVVFNIIETGPSEKGNSVANVYKEATLDNGLVVKVPMFIDVGEKVKIDTRTGEYIERVK